MVVKAIAHYAEKLDTAADTKVTFDGMQWEADGGFATGAVFTVQDDDGPALTYETGASEYDTTWIFTASNETKLHFVCLD